MAYAVAEAGESGGPREMTEGEIEHFQDMVFGESIDWDKVRVRKSALITDLADAKGVVVGNTIHVHPDYYHADFSQAGLVDQAFFAHELTHVWQYQNVTRLTPIRAIGEHMTVSEPYECSLDGRRFDQYGIEQQGMIINNYIEVQSRQNPILQNQYESMIYGPGGIQR
ncbi:DUF4157 domain-containing protein [Gammaproteobacteria bacterium AB-CW1]|uniref:DUF4157 domain-containing protein n=1 Tax=Natronospira elongata TaxID=3110268 RepID=A0AAP6JHJ5_9GAMM|nr:DUF4157 domain-containing protein [Gammaproteobacteria bacterium AB-CW1]